MAAILNCRKCHEAMQNWLFQTFILLPFPPPPLTLQGACPKDIIDSSFLSLSLSLLLFSPLDCSQQKKKKERIKEWWKRRRRRDANNQRSRQHPGRPITKRRSLVWFCLNESRIDWKNIDVICGGWCRVASRRARGTIKPDRATRAKPIRSRMEYEL